MILRYLLLTGATGLLGRYLASDLLESGNHLALLVRSSKHESATQRVESLLQHWEKQAGRLLPRPVVLEGDIRKPLLGLKPDDVKWVSNNCRAMMHSAASLKFHDDGSGEPWLSNIEGSRNVLELCQAADVRQLHYVSTAYVCGLRPGKILESELNCGQGFRNDYEKSKLEAEELVRAADCLDQLTVYRPAVISGDSQTGYTNTYHGIYLYLRMMALLVPRQPLGPDGKRQTRLRIPMTGEERRNVVPVDWVSKVMTRLYNNPKAHGHTFHLAPEECVTPKQGIEAGYSYYNSTGVEFVGYDKMDPSTFNAMEAELIPALSMYTSYERTDPTFDCSNVKRFAEDLPCPKIDESMFHTYIRYGEEDRWGKRRIRNTNLAFTAADIFAQIAPEGDNQSPALASVALNLLGPGGGQWTLRLASDRRLTCEPGLAGDAESIVQMTASEFFSLMDGPVESYQAKAIEQFFPISFSEPKPRVRTLVNPQPAKG